MSDITDAKSPLSKAKKHPDFGVTLCLRNVSTRTNFGENGHAKTPCQAQKTRVSQFIGAEIGQQVRFQWLCNPALLAVNAGFEKTYDQNPKTSRWLPEGKTCTLGTHFWHSVVTFTGKTGPIVHSGNHFLITRMGNRVKEIFGR